MKVLRVIDSYESVTG